MIRGLVITGDEKRWTQLAITNLNRQTTRNLVRKEKFNPASNWLARFTIETSLCGLILLLSVKRLNIGGSLSPSLTFLDGNILMIDLISEIPRGGVQNQQRFARELIPQGNVWPEHSVYFSNSTFCSRSKSSYVLPILMGLLLANNHNLLSIRQRVQLGCDIDMKRTGNLNHTQRCKQNV